ncbi:MAG: type I-B CRISPR-associated protein Cas7/Cst2/DevR [Clostridia bacterium]
MKKNGLTISLVFEAESANYGEGFGNITQLKKVSRGDGNAYSYISRQALRYNIINQLGWDNTECEKDGKDDKAVVQFAPHATIDKYPEIDFFGYMKTEKSKNAKIRNAVARLSNAISLESYNAETDFLTNMGLAKRVGGGNNIAQSEIHKSFYTYTITIDLDLIGIDVNDDINIPNPEKANRVKDFLGTIEYLYRDIKARRENFSPVFAIGGLYQRKNPYFENRIALNKKMLNLDKLLECINANEDTKSNTKVGYLSGSFNNCPDIYEKLNPSTIAEFFSSIKREVDNYYA